MHERLRAGLGRRLTAFALALLVEVLLVLLMLTLGAQHGGYKKHEVRLLTFDARREPEKSPAQPEKKRPKTAQAERPVYQPPEARQTPAPPQPVPSPSASPPPLIQLSREQMAAADIAAKPAPRPQMGPPDTGAPGDTPRVGTAPNGEPLYAARWYREPYDDELSGYLSTASGPGWGLIACRTAPNFRVEDCVKLDEWPEGSNIARAVLAAAWQFRVRPPQLGGRPMIGDWVRIRIDYGLKR